MCLAQCAQYLSRYAKQAECRLLLSLIFFAIIINGTDGLVCFYFVQKTKEDNQDLVQVFTDYMRSINPTNLGHFVASYIQYALLSLIVVNICTDFVFIVFFS